MAIDITKLKDGLNLDPTALGVMQAALDELKPIVADGVVKDEMVKINDIQTRVNAALESVGDETLKKNAKGAFDAYFVQLDPDKKPEEKQQAATEQKSNPIMQLLVGFLQQLGFIDEKTAQSLLGTSAAPPAAPATSASTTPPSTSTSTSAPAAPALNTNFNTVDDARNAETKAKGDLDKLRADRVNVAKKVEDTTKAYNDKVTAIKAEFPPVSAPAATNPMADVKSTIKTALDNNEKSAHYNTAERMMTTATSNKGWFARWDSSAFTDTDGQTFTMHLAQRDDSKKLVDEIKAVKTPAKDIKAEVNTALSTFEDDVKKAAKGKANAEFKLEEDLEKYRKSPDALATDKKNTKDALTALKTPNADGELPKDVAKQAYIDALAKIDEKKAKLAEHRAHKDIAEKIKADPANFSSEGSWGGQSGQNNDSNLIIDAKNEKIKGLNAEIEKLQKEADQKLKNYHSKVEEQAILEQREAQLGKLEPVIAAHTEKTKAEGELKTIDTQIQSLEQFLAKITTIIENLVKRDQEREEKTAREAFLKEGQDNSNSTTKNSRDGNDGNDGRDGNDGKPGKGSKPSGKDLTEEDVLNRELNQKKALLAEKRAELAQISDDRFGLTQEQRRAHGPQGPRSYNGNHVDFGGNPRDFNAEKLDRVATNRAVNTFNADHRDQEEQLRKEIRGLENDIRRIEGRLSTIADDHRQNPLNQAQENIDAVDNKLQKPLQAKLRLEAEIRSLEAQRENMVANESSTMTSFYDKQIASRQAQLNKVNAQIDSLKEQRHTGEEQKEKVALSENSKKTIEENKAAITTIDEQLRTIEKAKTELSGVVSIIEQAQSQLATITNGATLGTKATDQYYGAGKGANALLDEQALRDLSGSLKGVVNDARNAGANGVADKVENAQGMINNALGDGKITVQEMKDIQAALNGVKSLDLSAMIDKDKISLEKDRETRVQENDRLKDNVMEMKNSRTERDEARKELKETKTQLNDTRHDLNTLRQDLNTAVQDLSNMVRENGALGKKLNNTAAELDATRRTNGELIRDIQGTVNELKSNKLINEGLREDLKKAESTLQQFLKDNPAAATSQNPTIEQGLQKFMERIDGFKASMEGLTKGIDLKALIPTAPQPTLDDKINTYMKKLDETTLNFDELTKNPKMDKALLDATVDGTKNLAPTNGKGSQPAPSKGWGKE